MKGAVLIFLAQALLYAIICVNTRAIAQADYKVALLSDLAFASANFFVVRGIVLQPNSKELFFGYVWGSMLGTCIGIKLSTIL